MERKESQSSNGFKMGCSSCQIIKKNKKKIVTSTMKRISHLPWYEEIKHIFDTPLTNSKMRKESDKHFESWIFQITWISRNQQQFLALLLYLLKKVPAVMFSVWVCRNLKLYGFPVVHNTYRLVAFYRKRRSSLMKWEVTLKHQCLIFSPALNGYCFFEAAGACGPLRVWEPDSMTSIS